MALFVLALIFSSCFVSSTGEFQKFLHAPKVDGSLRFLVVGDWGRKGSYNQSEVAAQMGKVGRELDIDFVVSTGDNFYDDGLTGTDDEAFKESFTDIYTADALQKTWYAVLGNHDYRGDALAELSPALKQIDSRWLCHRSFVVNADIAELFFVDTTPFVEKYWTDPEEHKYDWREVAPRKKYMEIVLKNLELALEESPADWKIVVGHHPIRSAGHHGDTLELVNLLLPLLKEYNVDLYINGHDHCLQLIGDSESPIQFLTSGGGSKAWRGDVKEQKQQEFYYDGQGFAFVRLTRTFAEVVFYDVFGQVLHRWSISKELHTAA